MQKYPNIVQAEFFHVGGDPDMPFASFMADMQERIQDGFNDLRAGMDVAEIRTGIKTSVRFYDYDGSITQAAAREQAAQVELSQTLLKLGEAKSLIRRYLLYRRLERLSRDVSPTNRKSHLRSIASSAALLRQKFPVAIETWDHHFRPVRANEAHEVSEAIARSRNSWIFCFAHNADLFADENKVIAHSSM